MVKTIARKITILFLLVCFAATAVAQGPAQLASDTLQSRKKSTHPPQVSIAFFNHAVSLPFHKMIRRPIHPGVEAAYEYRYFEKGPSTLFQNIATGFFYNQYNGTGIYLKTSLAYRYTTRWGVFADAFAGLGYLRVYHPTAIYELQVDGTYAKARDKGFSSPLINFAFGIGYNIKSRSKYSISPFIRYGSLIQTRYSPELSVFPQTAFYVGVRINKK